VPDPAGSPDAEQTVAEQEEQARVRATLARLPQRQAQLLLMRAYRAR
jgi:DNA-directed RNA polymerase specialized sigma24 family protein